MIQTIQLIKFLYPFILLAVFFCLYKKEYSIMKRFCWRMTMTFSARKLFIIVVLSSLIFMNWCCYMTDPNWAVAFAAFMTCCLLFNRVADRVLHRLHERKRFWALTLMLALVSVMGSREIAVMSKSRVPIRSVAALFARFSVSVKLSASTRYSSLTFFFFPSSISLEYLTRNLYQFLFILCNN